jgi:hypothetical protein
MHDECVGINYEITRQASLLFMCIFDDQMSIRRTDNVVEEIADLPAMIEKRWMKT